MSDHEAARAIVRFFGRVRGPGFRDLAVRVARDFAVAGTVSSLRAGAAVEVGVEGHTAAER